jgi:hypothetical protein
MSGANTASDPPDIVPVSSRLRRGALRGAASSGPMRTAASARMPATTDREGIHKLELISDRALAPGEEDRFAHDDFVDQLEALIRPGIDTANIALYGSWGADKSGSPGDWPIGSHLAGTRRTFTSSS